MSEWGSFATEFIGCEKCFKAVGDAFAKYRGRGTIEPQIISKRIYAGYASGLYSGEEMNNFDGELRDLIEPNICHPVQIAVLSEAIGSRAILTYTPETRERVEHQEQRATNLEVNDSDDAVIVFIDKPNKRFVHLHSTIDLDRTPPSQ